MTHKEIQTLGYREFGQLSAELIQNTGGFRFRAFGMSMLPSIRSGDVLRVEKVDSRELRAGDVVMIRTATESLLAHRIVRRDGDAWITCGDALNKHDAPFTDDRLIGRVTTVERHGVERKISPAWAMFMAAVSRYGTSLAGRIVKRLLRARGSRLSGGGGRRV